ncbi:hypothetical protein EVAR_89507_1 [Eumeta japonica]|uniref:Uncharacterized protein n=1 Tax=Eumeta variegata TaxID=151549 RepID=A0A4C1Y4K4_EUMVA|nr:hypothetical protein EVAR_89507_1 [Eumeta japonica]
MTNFIAARAYHFRQNKNFSDNAWFEGNNLNHWPTAVQKCMFAFKRTQNNYQFLKISQQIFGAVKLVLKFELHSVVCRFANMSELKLQLMILRQPP